MRTSLTAAGLAAVLIAAAPAAAWFCDGHMLVAQIAQDSGIMSAATLDKVNTLVKVLADDYPATGPSFVESACWADDLKYPYAAPQEASWHFIDLPVVRDNAPSVAPPDVNAVWAVNAAHSTVYDKFSTQIDKARQLRFLTHIVGDLHQPLHAACLFSSQFPSGDRGGNSYPVTLPDGATWTNELHALWDGGAGQWYGDLPRPLNATGQAWLDSMSAKIMGTYTRAAMEPFIKEYNTSTWANESWTIANTFVYTAPQTPTVIPQSYMDQAQLITAKQVAIGGYRLAELLEYIFTTGRDDEVLRSKAAGDAHDEARSARLRLPAAAAAVRN